MFQSKLLWVALVALFVVAGAEYFYFRPQSVLYQALVDEYDQVCAARNYGTGVLRDISLQPETERVIVDCAIIVYAFPLLDVSDPIFLPANGTFSWDALNKGYLFGFVERMEETRVAPAPELQIVDGDSP